MLTTVLFSFKKSTYYNIKNIGYMLILYYTNNCNAMAWFFSENYHGKGGPRCILERTLPCLIK